MIATPVTRLFGIGLPVMVAAPGIADAVSLAEAGALPLVASEMAPGVRAATGQPFATWADGLADAPVLLTRRGPGVRPSPSLWLHSVASLGEALEAVEAGVDGLLLEGGLPAVRSFVTAVPDTPLIADAVRDGAELAAALALGAGAGLFQKLRPGGAFAQMLAEFAEATGRLASSASPRGTARADRSADALRANLRRRKQQARGGDGDLPDK